jgi:hypothetical protein
MSELFTYPIDPVDLLRQPEDPLAFPIGTIVKEVIVSMDRESNGAVRFIKYNGPVPERPGIIKVSARSRSSELPITENDWINIENGESSTRGYKFFKRPPITGGKKRRTNKKRTNKKRRTNKRQRTNKRK